jgi:predicted patatin/cPLA2 family phospholipase
MQFAFRRFTKVLPVLKKQATLYGRSLEFMARPPEGIKVVQIAPSEDLRTQRASQNVDSLNEDYQLGKRLGRDYLQQIQNQTVFVQSAYQSQEGLNRSLS